MVMYFLKEQDQSKKSEASIQQADKKIDHVSVLGLCSHRNTVFEVMRCFYHFLPVKKYVHP